MLFLDSATAPTVADQFKAYKTVFEAFGDRKVVIRTLDAGADKPLAFAPSEEEENPALGVRGYRMDRVFPQLLDDQLEAIAQAAKATGAKVWVMAPMVSTVHEARAFTDKVRSHDLPVAGMMVEVPAAALRARHMMEIVDFASIGTNDLTQYAMATDRMAGALAELLDPWQPAVLDLIAATGVRRQGGRQAGRRVRRGGPRSAAGAGAGRARHQQPVDGAVRRARGAIRAVPHHPCRMRGDGGSRPRRAGRGGCQGRGGEAGRSRGAVGALTPLVRVGRGGRPAGAGSAGLTPAW